MWDGIYVTIRILCEWIWIMDIGLGYELGARFGWDFSAARRLD